MSEWQTVREGRQVYYHRKPSHKENPVKWYKKLANPYIMGTVAALVAAAGITLSTPQHAKHDIAKPKLEQIVQQNTAKIAGQKEPQLTIEQRKYMDFQKIAEDVYQNGAKVKVDLNDLRKLEKHLETKPDVVVASIMQQCLDRYNHKKGALRKDLEDGMSRSKELVGYLKHLAKQYGLSSDKRLVGLGMQESFFSDAQSKDNALGQFQLLVGTGANHGLTAILGGKGKDGKYNVLYSELGNPWLAGMAAARELNYWEGFFGDPATALARYNSGKPERYFSVLNRKDMPFEEVAKGYAAELKKLLMVWTGDRRDRRKLDDIMQNLRFAANQEMLNTIIKHNYPQYINIEAHESVRLEKYQIGTKTHAVKRGENLLKISRAYGVDVQGLKRVNRLNGYHIKANQELRIPVKKQAVLDDIQKHYGLSQHEVKFYNPHLVNAQLLPAKVNIVVPNRYIVAQK